MLRLLRISSPWTALRALLGWLCAGIGIFVLAGWIGGLIPSRHSLVPADGPRETLYVETNGLHVGIIVPTERFDPGLLEPKDFRDGRTLTASHLRFGWGQHEFYRRVPDWSALTPGIAIRALLLDGRAMVHVSGADAPQPGQNVRAITVSRVQMNLVIAAIVRSFRRDAAGDAVPVAGNWPDEAFYPAHGRYSAAYTCNSWAADVLNGAGIRTGAWPIFASGVMRWLPPS